MAVFGEWVWVVLLPGSIESEVFIAGDEVGACVVAGVGSEVGAREEVAVATELGAVVTTSLGAVGVAAEMGAGVTTGIRIGTNDCSRDGTAAAPVGRIDRQTILIGSGKVVTS